jgi:hypothetical protein
LDFGPIARSATTVHPVWLAAASRYGTFPSAPAAPRTALPSTAIAGNSTGPPTGAPVGAMSVSFSWQALTWSARSWATRAAKTRSMVSGCGATNTPSPLRRHPINASSSWSAEPTQSVISTRVTCPAATAAVHKPRIEDRLWRRPRGSRGSGTRAKHSSNPDPLPSAQAAAVATSTPTTSATDPGAARTPPSGSAPAARAAVMADRGDNGASGGNR